MPQGPALARGGSPVDDRSSPRAAERFACFRSAVARGHQHVQREQESRSRRCEKARARAAEAPGGQRGSLDRRFREREHLGLLAKCRAWSTDDFVSLRVLGRGAFGTVHLVQHRQDGQRYALKQIGKARYCSKNRRRLFLERDALAAARGRWCVGLHATFQDAEHVYMLMDFLPGGDLMFHLMERDRFTAAETAFYMAELLEGLDVVHKLGFLHRDVKPDNLVLGSTGHLKLLDFGLARQAGAGEPDAQVGTFEYMAPEVFFGGAACGPELDLWSVGVVAFECLAGGIPFNMNHLQGQAGYECMRRDLANHREVFAECLRMTSAAGVTDAAAKQLLSRLVCPKELRLSVEMARREPFFAGLDFGELHLREAPFARACAAAAGRWNFDDLGSQALPPAARLSATDELEWAWYDFDREAHELNGSSVDLGWCGLDGQRSPGGAPRAAGAAPGGARPAGAPEGAAALAKGPGPRRAPACALGGA